MIRISPPTSRIGILPAALQALAMLAVLILGAAAAWAMLVAAAHVAATPAQGAGLLVTDGGLGGALEIKEHNVKGTINHGAAARGK